MFQIRTPGVESTSTKVNICLRYILVFPCSLCKVKCHTILNSTNRFGKSCVILSKINKKTFKLCLPVFSILEIHRKLPAWPAPVDGPWPGLLTPAGPARPEDAQLLVQQFQKPSGVHPGQDNAILAAIVTWFFPSPPPNPQKNLSKEEWVYVSKRIRTRTLLPLHAGEEANVT